jgi:hypothetical protein
MQLTNWPIEFAGTLKNITPEQAKKIFQFDLPEEAKGITFVHRNGKVFMKPYFPERYKNKGVKQTQTNEYMKLINKIGHLYLDDLIRPIWNKPAEKQKFYSGFNFFASINLKLIREGLENILISIGDLPPPKITFLEYKKDALRFSVDKPDMELGVGILNPRIMTFTHLKPKTYDTKVNYIRSRAEEIILFLYYKHGKNYSNSIATRVKKSN